MSCCRLAPALRESACLLAFLLACSHKGIATSNKGITTSSDAPVTTASVGSRATSSSPPDPSQKMRETPRREAQGT